MIQKPFFISSANVGTNTHKFLIAANWNFDIFFQLNEMRDEAKTWWLVSGPDVASSYFFKRKSVLHLNHKIPAGIGNNY